MLRPVFEQAAPITRPPLCMLPPIVHLPPWYDIPVVCVYVAHSSPGRRTMSLRALLLYMRRPHAARIELPRHGEARPSKPIYGTTGSVATVAAYVTMRGAVYATEKRAMPTLPSHRNVVASS